MRQQDSNVKRIPLLTLLLRSKVATRSHNVMSILVITRRLSRIRTLTRLRRRLHDLLRLSLGQPRCR